MQAQVRVPPAERTQDAARVDSSGLSRRGFLGGLGGAAAAAMAGSTLAVEPLFFGGRAAHAAPHIGPLLGQDRIDAAYAVRVAAAQRMLDAGPTPQNNNDDETDLPGFIGSYSKGLPHDGLGEVDPVAYAALIDALTSGDPADFAGIPASPANPLTNPQSGLAFELEGLDPQQHFIPPAPKFESAEEAGEMVELYWQALLRDTNFISYDGAGQGSLVSRACAELSALSDFRGPKIGGQVTPQTLFRDSLGVGTPHSTLNGPYCSQFMLLTTPFGAEVLDRRMRTLASGGDHMTDFAEWLAIQNGQVPSGTMRFENQRRYIRCGRDLGQWVHIDVLFQAYFSACLILGTPPEAFDGQLGGLGCPLNPGNPYAGVANQIGFGTWGGPFFKTILCEVATRALKAVWFQKWFVHRRLRPEVFAGRVHVHKSGLKSYPIHADVLDSEAADRVRQRHGTWLLPMVFTEGSPTHPAYGAGHATVAGACVTILKALFDEDFVIPNPVVPNPAGTNLQQYSGPPLTVGGELNKVASNVATGRNIAGVHWRTDAAESLRLGERVAIELLRDTVTVFNEGPGSLTFTGFDGQTITIAP